jgi:hypothetical protein
MLLGAFQESGQIGDLWVMIVLGALGWLFKSTGFPRAPFLIGFVLAVPLERYYFLTDSVYTGAEWLLRPWVLVFLAVLLVPVVMAGMRRLRARRSLDADDGHHREPADEDGRLADTPWSLATAIGMLVLFAAAWVAAGQFSADARLVPRLLCTVGVVVAAYLVITEIRTHRSRPAGAAGRGLSPAVAAAGGTFAWMASFLVLVVLGGYVAALLVFVPAFLLWVARTRPRTVVVYTVVTAVLVAVLPALLHVDLPAGLLAF